jgi:nitrogen fixation/metabolism regulation signal transduction histidine kinase
LSQVRRRAPSAFHSFPFLATVFALAALASFLLADGGLSGIFQAAVLNSPRGFILLVAVPLAMILCFSIVLYVLVSQAIHEGSAGASARSRFYAHCAFILAAVIPVVAITTRFVDTALGSWFSGGVGSALESGSVMADLYRGERERDIERVASRFMTALYVSNLRARSVEVMNDVRTVDAYAAAYQVYLVVPDGSGGLAHRPIAEAGDSSLFFPRAGLGSVRDGYLDHPDRDRAYRYGRIIRYSGEEYVCVYTSVVAQGFTERSAGIAEAAERVRTVSALGPFLPVMGITIFFVFCLPAMLALVCLAWYASYRASLPVAAARDAAARCAAGDRAIRLIPHGTGDIDDIQESINQIARSRAAPKDKRVVIKV